MSLTAISLFESVRAKLFMNSTTTCVKTWNQTFLGSVGRNESSSDQLAQMGDKKIFHELDVHHV